MRSRSLLALLVPAMASCAASNAATSADYPEGTLPVIVCDVSECNEDYLPPVLECRDGSISGPTGACLRHSTGCGWEVRLCDEDYEYEYGAGMGADAESDPSSDTPASFDSSGVSDTLRASQPALDRCYEEALRDAPDLGGRVAVAFTIEEDGTTSSIDVSDAEANTNTDALESCVEGVVSRLRFDPAPVGGTVRFSTAFTFTPETADP